MKTCRFGAWSLVVMLVLWSGLGWAQQPKPGGTLRLSLAGDLTFFNANQGPAPGYFTLWVWNNIFNSLLTLTPPPELKVVPELAKSWDVLDNGKTYVFHLVEGVKFHDGTDFDATAAKWNFDRILDPEVKSWVRPYYEEIDKVEAVDEYTLRIQMKEPSGALPIALAGYFQGVPMASPKSFETYGKDWVQHPTGTGPYILKEWIPGKHVILGKNPTYFKQGLPYLDTLEFRIIKDSLTASASLRSGEIDFVVGVPHLLEPLLDVLRTLVEHYEVSIVLCTATQPALDDTPGFRGLPNVREIVLDPAHCLFERRLRRYIVGVRIDLDDVKFRRLQAG